MVRLFLICCKPTIRFGFDNILLCWKGRELFIALGNINNIKKKNMIIFEIVILNEKVLTWLPVVVPSPGSSLHLHLGWETFSLIQYLLPYKLEHKNNLEFIFKFLEDINLQIGEIKWFYGKNKWIFRFKRNKN